MLKNSVRYYIEAENVKKRLNSIEKVCVIIIVLAVLVLPSEGKLLLPKDYPEGTCELAAKELQKEFGGQLVFIVPFENGVNIKGGYIGAWINKIYVKGNNKYFYIDYPNQKIFSSKEDAIKEYKAYYDLYLGDKLERKSQGVQRFDVDVRMFVMGEDKVNFPMVYHY